MPRPPMKSSRPCSSDSCCTLGRNSPKEGDGHMAPHRCTGTLPRVGLGLLVLLLSGACATSGMRQAGTQPGMTRETYASLLSAIRSDPAARAGFTNRCTEGRAAEPQASRELTARMLGVDPADIDRVFCQRETAAMARGEISYEDFTAL